MEIDRQRARGDGESASAAPEAQGARRACLARLAEFRERVEALGKELDDFRRRLDELELALPALPEKTAPPHEAPPRTAEEGPDYLEGIQGRIHLLLHEETESAERMQADPVSDARMVCPSCGTLADRAAEACPDCGAPTAPAPDGAGRIFPLPPERFLRVFNDRYGWFLWAFDKATHYADRKGDYDKAIDLLQPVARFMEENLSLLRSKHKDFKLALAYAYLGRCCFQSGRIEEAVRHYKKGILLRAGNSYNCEIGLTAVYRDLVRRVRETGRPLAPEARSYLSPREIETLNTLGTRDAT